MSIEYLVEKYSKLIYKICYDMLANPLDAEDTVQEVYISFYKNLYRYEHLAENEQKNIICKIALNRCKDILKSKATKLSNMTDHNLITLENYSADQNLEEEIMENEKKVYIVKIINELKRPYSNIMYDYYINELTLDEMAAKNEVSKQTLKMQLYRAKKKFKETIEICGGEGLL